MSLRMHRWRESTSDAGCQIAESIDLQPPEAIICWDGLDPSDVRPHPRPRQAGLVISVVLVAMAVALSVTVLH